MRYFFDLLSCGLCLFPFSPQAVCSKKCAQFAVYERVNNFFAFGLPRLDAPRIVTSYDVGDPKFANRFIITIKASPSRSAGAIQVSSSTSGALPIPSSTQELNITTQTPVIVEVSGTPEVAEARFRKAEESTEAPVINREIKLRQLWTELWDVWVPKLEDDTYVFFDALLYKLRNMRNLGDALLTTWSVVCNIAEGFILPSACFIYSIIGALGHLIFLTSVGPFIDLTLFTGSLMIAAVYAVCQFVCHYKRIKDVERMRDMLRQKRASLDRIPSKEQLDGMILAAAKLATIPLQLKLWLRQLVLNKYMRENHRLRASNAHKAAVIVTRDADLATRDATIVALRVTDGEVEARRQALIARQTHNTLPAPRDPGSPPRSLLWLQNTLLRPLAGDSYEDRQALRDIVQGIKSFMKAAHANIGAADEILLLKGQMRADITNLRRVGEDELRETYIEYQRLIKKNDAQLLLARKACDDEISTAAHAHALEVARLTAKLDHLERKVGDEQVLRQRAQDEAARNKLAASMIQAPPPAATQSCGTQADLSQMEESEVESNSQARDEEGDESEAWETGGCGSDDKSDDHDSGSDDDSDDEDSNGNPSGPVLTFPGTRFPASLGRYTVTWPADQAEKIDAGESVAKKEGQQDEEGREDDEEAKEEQEETGKQEPEVRKKDNREDTDGQAEDGEDEEEHVNQMHALKGSNNEEDDKRQSGNQLQEDQTPNDAEHEQPPSATNLAGDRGSVGDSDSERVTKAIGELRSKAKALAVLNKTSNDEMAVLEAMAELHQFALTNIPSQHRMSALKVTGAGAFMQRLAKGVTRTQGQGQNMLVQSNAQSIIDLWRLLPPAIEQTTEAYAATIRTVDSVAKENPAPTSQASAPTSGPSDGTAEPKSSDNKPTSPKKASASNGFDAAKFAGSDFGFGPNASANASKTSAADGEDSDDGKLRKKRSAGPRLSGTAAGGSIVPLSSMTPSSFSTLPDVNFGGPTNASFPFSAPGSTNGAVAASNDSITAGSRLVSPASTSLSFGNQASAMTRLSSPNATAPTSGVPTTRSIASFAPLGSNFKVSGVNNAVHNPFATAPTNSGPSSATSMVSLQSMTSTTAAQLRERL